MTMSTGRPESSSSSAWASPGRLIRTLSTNASAVASNGQARHDVNASKPQQQQHPEQATESPAIDPLSQVSESGFSRPRAARNYVLITHLHSTSAAPCRTACGKQGIFSPA